ncbi:LOW QUALITY PROTEIN: dynein axonemal intermediate chain 7 homolog [Macrobrachium nipponense]|uniref:LOW QUALITY PROTEIN: dynein axonemal intermediate chain 7 homolog n=1 Tax=Macrobrachium nipponense TaxID=159736 RepID=UPI0030C7C364
MPPKQQQQGGSRKLSKEEREKLKRLEQEGRRQREAEEAKIREEEEEAARLQKEAEEEAKREARRIQQKKWRFEQMMQTRKVTRDLDHAMEMTRDRLMEEEEWERMMRCDGLPDPTSVPEMNRYLSLWRADEGTATLKGALQKTDQVIHVISELEGVMEERDATEKQLRDWREIWLELQAEQKSKLNEATYNQLLDLRGYSTMKKPGVYSFFTSSPLVSLALWSNTTRSPKNNIHKIDELGFTFTLPADLSEMECVVRVMRTEYDHYSKFARTFDTPNVPEPLGELLEEDIPEEDPPPPEDQSQEAAVIYESLQYSEYQIWCGNLSSFSLHPSAEEDIPEEDPPPPEDQSQEAEGDGKDNMGAPPAAPPKPKSPHLTDTAPGELNLRKHRVQGGIYTIDLLEVPPQPRVLVDCTITQVEEVCSVSRIHWQAKYNPPNSSGEGSSQRRRDPEAVEQEMRQLEKELQKLLLITIKLPDSAFWFEPPLMVLWDEVNRYWTNVYFQDVKYNEEQCVMQFRTTRLGVMGLAMNRYANLPFQSWELKPRGTDAVSLTLSAAVVQAEFTIMEGNVQLSNLQDGARSALSHLYNKPMKPKTLINTLQFYGINLFPDRDSYCYIDGLPSKHRPTEQHLYRCMALVAPAINFAWSRWNLLAGQNKLVFQMKTKKLISDESQVGQPLVLVTPQRTCVLECTEISQAFSMNQEDPEKYHADLYQMVLDDLGPEVNQIVKAASPVFTHTIHTMLKSSSIISYC